MWSLGTRMRAVAVTGEGPGEAGRGHPGSALRRSGARIQHQGPPGGGGWGFGGNAPTNGDGAKDVS